MKKLLLLLSVLVLVLSGCKPTTTTSPEAPAAKVGIEGVTVACPVACKTMSCPPPNGTLRLCCPKYPYTQTCP